MILQGNIEWGNSPAKINLYNDFDLYPDIKLIIDKVTEVKWSETEGGSKTYAQSYDMSDCASNIKIKTVLYNNCGQLTCRLLHEDCEKIVQEGDRVRLYLNDKCRFCGFVFTRSFNKGKMSITCFDYLRYFKAPLSYNRIQMISPNGSTGMTASDVFRKLCMDLAIPYDVITNSTIPVPAQRYDRKTAFNILEFAINQTIINSPSGNRQYFTYFHESYLPEDDDGSILFQTGGQVEFHLRNNLTVDVPITDSDLLIDYNFQTSIDKQTFNEIILYKDEKTYVSKTGKSLKKGKKTGTRIVRTSSNNLSKAKYGYLPYYHQVPDGYTEAQMDAVAEELRDILGRVSQELSLECYGILGLRAGYLVPVYIESMGGQRIGQQIVDEKTGDIRILPVYRTVKECELIVEHPLKMNVTLSSAEFGEYDV